MRNVSTKNEAVSIIKTYPNIPIFVAIVLISSEDEVELVGGEMIKE